MGGGVVKHGDQEQIISDRIGRNPDLKEEVRGRVDQAPRGKRRRSVPTVNFDAIN